MKRFILIAAVLSCATVLMAGMDKVIIKQTNVSTSATATISTSNEKITGYVNRLDVTFGNSTSTVIMTVIATNSLTGLTTTVPVTGTAVATNYSNQLTNYVQRLSLYDEAIIVSVTGAAYSGQSVIATFFYERP